MRHWDLEGIKKKAQWFHDNGQSCLWQPWRDCTIYNNIPYWSEYNEALQIQFQQRGIEREGFGEDHCLGTKTILFRNPSHSHKKFPPEARWKRFQSRRQGKVRWWERDCHDQNSGWPKIWPMTPGQRYEPKGFSYSTLAVNQNTLKCFKILQPIPKNSHITRFKIIS